MSSSSSCMKVDASDASFVTIRCQKCIHWEEKDVNECKLRETHRTIRKLFELLVDKRTAKMTQRIKAMLNYFLKSTENNFCVHDLNFVVDSLKYLLNSKLDKCLENYIEKLLHIARNPPILFSPLCEARCSSLIILLEYYLSHLGKLVLKIRVESVFLIDEIFILKRFKIALFAIFIPLCITYTEDDSHQENIVKALHDLFCSRSATNQIENAVKMSHLFVSLEKSSVIGIVSDVMEKAIPSIYYIILDFLLLCSLKSDKICSNIIARGSMNIIILRMSPHHPVNSCVLKTAVMQNYQKLVALSITLLRELLSNYDKLNTKIKVNLSCEAIYILKKMVTKSNEDSTLFSKDTRNQLLCILVELQRLSHEMGIQETFIRSLFYPDTIYAEFCPQKTQGDFVPKLSCTSISEKDREDREFGKVLLVSMFYILRSGTTLSHNERLHIARLCIPHLTNDTDLLKFNFTVGRQFIPFLKDEFLKILGCQKLLSTIKKLIKKSYCGEILIEALKTINLVSSMEGNDKIISLLREHNTILLLVNILDSYMHDGLATSDKIALLPVIQTLIALTKDDTKAQETHFENLNRVICTILKNSKLEGTYRLITEKHLLIGAIVLLRLSIIKNPTNCEKFIKQGLVYNLMDLLHVNNDSVVRIVLSSLVDLSEHHSAFPLLLTWREKNTGKPIFSKLCDIWRKYEKEDRVARGEGGIIENVDKPLMGTPQLEQMKNVSLNCSPSLLDAFFNIRSKIFALVQRVEAHCKVTEIVKDQYKINVSFNVNDRITLLIIENYLPLKINELWNEIIFTSQAHNMKLSQTGNTVLEDVNDHNKAFVVNIRNQQIGIMNYHRILKCTSENYDRKNKSRFR